MARQHERDFDRVFNFARSSLFIQPLSDPITLALDDEGLAVDPDEPPEYRITASPQTYNATLIDAPTSKPTSDSTSVRPYIKKSATPMTRQSSLLTEGILTAANLKHVPLSPTAFMSRAGSQASAYSLTSNHGLTSDGGLSSPNHSGTPSPPLPPVMQAGIGAAPKARTIKFACEQPADSSTAPRTEQILPSDQAKPRKTCISFACAPPRPTEPQRDAGAPSKIADRTAEPAKRTCTIKFACDARPKPTNDLASKRAMSPAPFKDNDLQVTPKATAVLAVRHRSSQSTIVNVDGTTKAKPTTGNTVSPSEVRKLEKKRKDKSISGVRPEDEDWMTEDPKPRKPITVSDTLRKENAIRKLAEEASQEIDEDYDIDDIVDDDEFDEDLPATGSRYMAFDDDESDGGHETDDEEGFAASDDDESDDDPDFQFWTTAQSGVVPANDHHELLRPHHQHRRTGSDSSLDSHIRLDPAATAPRAFLSAPGSRRRKSPKEARMRPGTPELPDSTDFVCGTLDEDRPLEEAYLSCIKQRKLEKRGFIPQDLDPSFPTSDPENNDYEEDEVTEGLASTASDHHFLGGRFDESDVSADRGRHTRTKAPSPRRLHSPPPPKSRFKSPAPTVQLRAKSPAPRKLFGRSPRRSKSPAPARMINSPPTSPKGLQCRAPQLAQRNMPARTASLPHTPNPFFVAHERRMRARSKKQLETESHDRGPIDIKQGLEARKLRRKEQYWRKHCRDHKDKSRRCAPGKGAERMRELGLEMAHRNRAYGQKLQLMLSV